VLGKPISAPTCNSIYTVYFLSVHPQAYLLFSAILFCSFSEENTINTLFAAYAWLYCIAEGKQLLPVYSLLPVCYSFSTNLFHLSFQQLLIIP